MIDAEKLIRYLAQNSWTESILAYPNPATHVEYHGLLDHLVKEHGVPEADVIRWVDEEIVKIETGRAKRAEAMRASITYGPNS